MTFSFVPTPFTGRPLLQTGVNGRNIDCNRRPQWRCAQKGGKKKGKGAKSQPKQRTPKPKTAPPAKKDAELASKVSSMTDDLSNSVGTSTGEEKPSQFSSVADGASPVEEKSSQFSAMAAGPGGGSGMKMRGRLGSQKRTKKTIEKKTAADFIAEGIQDDVEDMDPSVFDDIPMPSSIGSTATENFVQEDIRFGVGDVADPFLEESVKNLAAKELATEEADKKSVGKQLDVTGDGGVLKRILTVAPRGQETIPSGASVTVSYVGKLEDGTTFDSNEEGFQFTLGTGTVIKGWESGVSTMKLGEKAELELVPKYAYGRRGVPPTIPGNSTLTFTIQILDVQGGGEDRIRKVEELNPSVKATPQDIARDYGQLLEETQERKKKMSLFDRFYFISPFASQTGEKPPWWLNPRITFFLIFATVGVAFYFTVIAGGIYQGIPSPDEATKDVNIFY